MALAMETFNSASIGLSKLHFAKQTNKGSASLFPTYEAFVRIDGLVSGTITQNGEIVSDAADDNPGHETALNYSSADISLEITGLGPAGYEYVTGRIVSAAGGTVMMTGQNPPNLAAAFEVLNGQRKRMRYVVYDCLFPEGEISLQTKGDGIEFGHTPLEGKIAELLYEGEIEKKSDGTMVTASGIRFMTMTEDSADFNQTKWDNFFKNVQFPSGTASVPAADFTAFSFAAGDEDETVLTIAGADITKFVYVTGERARPLVGTPISGGTVIATGGKIADVAVGTFISVYGVDVDDKAVAFGAHKLLAAEIGSE